MFASIIQNALPLYFISIGALFSEFAGQMALFLDSIINVAAFTFFAVTVLSSNAILGIFAALTICTIFIGFFAFTCEKLCANPFIAGLSVGLFLEGLITFVSVRLFGTRGVLTSDLFNFSRQSASFAYSLIFLVLSAIFAVFLKFTKKGLCYQITGSNPEVLESKGVSAVQYRIKAWMISAFCASCAGCAYAARISSFVPNISSSRGWLALVIVFLGKKDILKMIPAVLVFSITEYLASNIQNIIPSIPSAILIILPYLTALMLIIFQPKRKSIKN